MRREIREVVRKGQEARDLYLWLFHATNPARNTYDKQEAAFCSGTVAWVIEVATSALELRGKYY